MKDFKNLQVWEKSHSLTLSIYGLTKSFPKEELFGLTSQVRRAVASIPTNIAEGCGRSSDPDFSRFLQIAFGSACEVEYQLILAKDLKYIDDVVYTDLNGELLAVKKMLASLISNIRADR
ncbi:MAG TPA: four helix bundle protein [Pyrinomonadaceae bacterium]|nr:four helix bundle protein [Pyrinomonadaceae bacterium]